MASKFTQIFHSSKNLISTLDKVTGGTILQTTGGRGVIRLQRSEYGQGDEGSRSIFDRSVGSTVQPTVFGDENAKFQETT